MTARALTARPARFFLGAGSTALALALGGAPLALSATAHAAPKGGGTNGQGSTTLHDAATDILIQANDPHLCAFKLVSDNYATDVTTISYEIVNQAGGKTPSPVTDITGTISLTTIDGQNRGESAVLTLPAGHYKETSWQGVGTSSENGADNWKTFWSDCQDSGGTTGGDTTTTTGGSTAGTTTTSGGSTAGDTTTSGGSTAGDTTTSGGSTAGDTTTTGGSTAGDTTTTGGSTGSTTGDTVDSTTGGDNPAGTTGEITGGGTGAVVETETPAVLTPAQPTLGGGAVQTPSTLPFTGSNTGTLALWGLASLLGGIGFCSIGQRQGKRVR